MKKNLIILLSLIFVVAFSVTAYAQNTKLEDKIISAVESFSSEVDISDCSVDPETALKTYFDLYNTHASLSYASNNARCEYMDGHATKLLFSYVASTEEVKKQKQATDAEINKIATLAQVGKNDMEKICIVHDYLVKNSSYDRSFQSATPYDLLVNKKGTCISYSRTMQMIAFKLGLECEIINNVEMNHSWNEVKVDGQWYNVDITYDAVSYEGIGSMTYANSLKSDKYFKVTGYQITATNHKDCTSDQYDAMM